MSALSEIRPRRPQRIIDLVKAANVNVSDWANFEKGALKAASNPKYCYEWSFVEPKKVVVLNLWYSQLKEREGTIVRDLNMREVAQQTGRASVEKDRARKMDKAIQVAVNDGLPIRVVVCEGAQREEKPGAKASRVEKRLLDPVPWAVTHYDLDTGQCTLTRGAHVYKELPQLTKLKSELHHEMIAAYEKTGKETGYWGRYFLRSVKKHGGFETAKRMLAKKLINASDQKGFRALVEAGRPDLSVESLVLQPKFKALFTATELAEAQRRLDSLPAHLIRNAVPPEYNFADTIADNELYSEGAKKTITVNAYERDPAARKACLKRHGIRCAVCNMSFEEEYGKMGKGFIHVHHKKPLAGANKEYKVNPSKDLIPVCPNCHAMLHTVNPPLGIEELKERANKWVQPISHKSASG